MGTWGDRRAKCSAFKFDACDLACGFTRPSIFVLLYIGPTTKVYILQLPDVRVGVGGRPSSSSGLRCRCPVCWCHGHLSLEPRPKQELGTGDTGHNGSAAAISKGGAYCTFSPGQLEPKDGAVLHEVLRQPLVSSSSLGCTLRPGRRLAWLL